MSNPEIKLNFDISKAVKKLKDVKQDLNLQGLLKAIGLRLHGWVAENFKKEGELAGGWAPLAESTIAARIRRRGGSAGDIRILQDTGQLRMSFDSFGERGYKVNLKTVEIGSLKEYARFQHEYYARTRKPARSLIPTVEIAKDISTRLIEARIAIIRRKHGSN